MWVPLVAGVRDVACFPAVAGVPVVRGWLSTGIVFLLLLASLLYSVLSVGGNLLMLLFLAPVLDG